MLYGDLSRLLANGKSFTLSCRVFNSVFLFCCISVDHNNEKAAVIDSAKECYRNGRLDLLVEDDEEAKRDGMRLERFMIVGISCIRMSLG